MAAMMIFIYFRYSRFRITSAAEIKGMREKFSTLEQELKESEHKLLLETKTEGNKIQNLLVEIDELRKEKENEVRLRLNAEKQIELTLQKIHDLERMIDDWQLMQDAVMNDCKDTMFKIGNDLYKKLNVTYRQETETNKNLVGKLSKNISEFFEKASTNLTLAPVKNAPKMHEEKAVITQKTHQTHLDDHTKNLISDLIKTMNASGRMANKDYFLPANFDEQRAKLMLCELAFCNSGNLYLLDFKSCRYVDEYEASKQTNEMWAQENLKQKFERYVAYLGNPKYRDSILKSLAASRIKFDKVMVIALVPLPEEVKLLKNMGYQNKAHNLGIEILDFDEVNNIIL